MIDRKAEFGHPIEIQKNPTRRVSGLRGRARVLASALLALAIATPSASAQEGIVFEDDGRFPQCTNVKMADRSILFEDPLTAKPPFTAVHPQLRRATETLYMNGVYDLIARDTLPQGTRFRLGSSSQYETYCLPEQDNGRSRYFIPTDGGGINLPSGSKDDGLVEFGLPEGINPIVITRFAPRHKGGIPQKQDWLVFMVDQNETITARNTDSSFTVIGRGPLSIPIYRSENGSSVEFVLPERGFADDKPIPRV